MRNMVFKLLRRRRLAEVVRFTQRYISLQLNSRNMYKEGIIQMMDILCKALLMMDKAHEALPVAIECSELCMHWFGEEYPGTLKAMYTHAKVLHVLKMNSEALKIAQRCLEGSRRVLEDDNRRTLGAMSLVASIHLELGTVKVADSIGRECLEAQERVLGRNHPKTLETMLTIAHANLAMHRNEEAFSMGHKCLKRRGCVLGMEHVDTLETMSFLVHGHLQVGDLEMAMSMGRVCLEAQDRVLGPRHEYTLFTLNNLLIALERLQESDLLIAGRRELAWRMREPDPVTQEAWLERPSWRSSPEGCFVTAVRQRQSYNPSLPPTATTSSSTRTGPLLEETQRAVTLPSMSNGGQTGFASFDDDSYLSDTLFECTPSVGQTASLLVGEPAFTQTDQQTVQSADGSVPEGGEESRVSAARRRRDSAREDVYLLKRTHSDAVSSDPPLGKGQDIKLEGADTGFPQKCPKTGMTRGQGKGHRHGDGQEEGQGKERNHGQ